MKRITDIARIVCCLLVGTFLWVAPAGADELDQGKALMKTQPEQAAELICRWAQAHPKEKKRTPEALALCGRLLDRLQDGLTERAEKKCYWAKGAPRTPACMQAEAQGLNARFGSGSFAYEHAITYIPYTGVQYRRLLSDFPKSSWAAEADFYTLLREVRGHPDKVLPRIKAFLKRRPRGEWNRRGRLLWARVNEDVWFVHRKWSWVLFNSAIAPDELLIRAEPYRQEALRTYRDLMKDKKSFEGRAAAQEFLKLQAQQEDGVTYSIVNDSSPGTLDKWGIQ